MSLSGNGQHIVGMTAKVLHSCKGVTASEGRLSPVYVYADILIAINLFMNAVILWGTCLVTGVQVRWLRVMAGALLGAIVSVFMLLPIGAFLRLPISKLLLSFMMLGVVFYPLAWRRWTLVCAVFYLASFVIGGTALALLYFFDASTILTNGVFSLLHASWLTVLSAGVVIAVVGRWVWGRLAVRLWQGSYFLPVSVVVNDRVEQITALLDSGNSLRDPISRMPVMIADYSSVKSLLPEEFRHRLDQTAEGEWINLLQFLPDDWVARFHLVPYSSVGRRNGLLLGFRPDYVEVESNGRKQQNKGVIIGLSRKNISSRGDYHALLHPELVREAV
jgi:stage II sporulation protein GA (sporulation sigma-E factor processing peptidase)